MSVDFTGQKIKLTYQSLLHLDPASTGISANFEQVYDGDGTPSALYVSSTGIKVGSVVLSGQYIQLEDAGLNYVRLASPADVTSNYTVTMPATGPAGNDYILQADVNGTFSWIPTPVSATNNTFSTIAVAGQSDIVADSAGDTLTISAGSGITLTTNAATDTLTITSSITQYTDEMSQDATASLIQNGTGISWVYSDAGNTLTPTVTLAPFSTTNLAEGTNLYYTDERVDDRVANLIQNGTGITWAYDDVANTLTPTVTITQYTDEMSQDATASLIQNGTGITWAYNDGANTLTPTVTITQYTDEMAQDAVGTILTDSGRVDFTYNDGANTITADIVASSITSAYVDSTVTTNAFKTISVSGQSDVVADSAADTLTLAAGSNITITTNAGTDTITIAASGGGGSTLGSINYIPTKLELMRTMIANPTTAVTAPYFGTNSVADCFVSRNPTGAVASTYPIFDITNSSNFIPNTTTQSLGIGYAAPTTGATTNYANTGGTGNRTASITVTTNITWAAGVNSNVVNGDTTTDDASNSLQATTAAAINPGDYIQFDFGSNKVIEEVTIYSSTSTTRGSWLWAGSYDGVDFQAISSNTTWNNTTQVISNNMATYSVKNLLGCNRAGGYRYYRWIARTAGTSWPASWVREFEFKIATPSPNNLTLVTNTVTAGSVPTTGRVAVLATLLGNTLNTDLTAEISRDGGTTYTAVTLVDQGLVSITGPSYIDASNIFNTGNPALNNMHWYESAMTDISAQPSGTSMKIRLKTANNKESIIGGYYYEWA